MMQDYIDRKGEIIEKQQKRLMEANAKILVEMRKALEDEKTSSDVKLSISEWLKMGEFSFNRESSTGMKSEDKLALARLYFENTTMMVDSLKESNDSYIKNIDELIQITKNDIKKLDEEIENTNDPEKVASLKEEKDRKVMKY
jgi:hypothetical protein